jgi:hypothetical protein
LLDRMYIIATASGLAGFSASDGACNRIIRKLAKITMFPCRNDARPSFERLRERIEMPEWWT